MASFDDRVPTVWFRDTTQCTDSDIETASRTLSLGELRRAKRYRSPADRRDYIVAHCLLRDALAVALDTCPRALRFSPSANGKPYLVVRKPAYPSGSPFSFSLSHARGLVACAIASGSSSVGVDVEGPARRIATPPIAERYFTRSEVMHLRRCDPRRRNTRFLELWTLKEAFGKATGQGLTALGETSFDLALGNRVALSLPGSEDSARWHFAVYAPVIGFRLSVAICADAHKTPLVRPWNLRQEEIDFRLTPLRTCRCPSR